MAAAERKSPRFLSEAVVVFCDCKDLSRKQANRLIFHAVRFGATVCYGFFESRATHVVGHESWSVTDAAKALDVDPAALNAFRPIVVSHAWLEACIACKELVAPDRYMLKAESDSLPQSPCDDEDDDLDVGAGGRGTYIVAQHACQRITTIAGNLNRPLTDYLDKIARYYANHQRDSMRELAYMHASAALKAAPKQITSGTEAMQSLPYINKKTAVRIDEFCRSGQIKEFEAEFATDRYRVIDMLVKLPWAGPKIAAEWYEQGVRDIKDLNTVVSLENKNQLKCLQHYHDINTPITRQELDDVMTYIHKCLERVVPPFQLEVCGGFRRGKPDGKDIDLVITQKGIKPAAQLDRMVEALTSAGLLTQEIMRKNANVPGARSSGRRFTPHPDLAGDLEQWLGLFQWPLGTGPHRRIDLVFAHYDEYAYAILGWTGSEMFERSIREYAKGRRMYLNSRGMFRLDKDELVTAKCEEDIFAALGLEYRLPTERHC